MELEFITVSAAQQADLESARSLLAQRQEEERRKQTLIEAERKKQEAKKLLCTQADQVARQKATHQLFVGNRMGGDKEMFSDWATLQPQDDGSFVQASIHRLIPDDSSVTRIITIQLRLKDAHTEVISGAETVLRFNVGHSETYLRDNESAREVEVAPDSAEYTEVQRLLKTLENAEYETTQEPLIGS